MVDLKDSVWQDERGLPPDTGYLEDDDDLREYEPSMPATPGTAPIDTVVAPRLPPQALSSQPAQQQNQTNNYNLTMSPTFNQTITHRQRFGDPASALNRAPTTPRAPRTPRVSRARSRTPSRPLPSLPELPPGHAQELPQQLLGLPDGEVADESAQYGSAAYDSAIFEDPVVEASGHAQGNPAEVEWQVPFPEQQVPSEPQVPPPSADQGPDTPAPEGQQSVTAPFLERQVPAQPQVPPPGASTTSVHSPTEEVPSSDAATPPVAPSEASLPQLPLKRPFDTMTTLLNDDGELVRVRPDDDYHTGVFGPKPDVFYQAYLSSQYRKDDVPPDKLPDESDTTDSDHGGPSPGLVSAKRQLSRKELKQLDREVPWTQILRSNDVPEYLKAIDKEANSWLE